MAIDSNYKMSKPMKTMLNMMMTDDRKPLFKDAFCNAESFYEMQRKKKSIKIMDTSDEG
jgi:hypothetical protein